MARMETAQIIHNSVGAGAIHPRFLTHFPIPLDPRKVTCAEQTRQVNGCSRGRRIEFEKVGCHVYVYTHVPVGYYGHTCVCVCAPLYTHAETWEWPKITLGQGLSYAVACTRVYAAIFDFSPSILRPPVSDGRHHQDFKSFYTLGLFPPSLLVYAKRG